MPLANTAQSYGSVARILHWLTALLILTAIPLGLIANDLPYDTSEALAQKALLFSLHKTLGVTVFFVALIRILWALTQARPQALHPERRAETALAEVAHWLLYLSLVIVPLSGWVEHAATTGFAPILWPLGQGLPFVPQSVAVAEAAAALHWLFTKVLIVTILAHIAGALKHHLIDRDATLRRMISGRPAGNPRARHRSWPAVAAAAIYAAAAGVALALLPVEEAARSEAPMAESPVAAAPVAVADAPAAAPASPAPNWQVTEGTLGFGIRQMGAEVQGSFADWTAAIVFNEVAVDGKHGTVTVSIATDSLTLGSVTAQAKTADFFDTATHPTATFTADILPADQGYVAEGTLTLRGVSKPVTLPFTLTITGDTATMDGTTTLDRRDFGMGASYTDETSVGFAAAVTVKLTAQRVE